MTDTVRILGISGSLRRDSLNTRLLRAAAGLAPDGASVEVRDLRGIELYDDDVYQQGFPAAVAELRNAVAAADAVLVATPEYNYSIPGVLKNAIDWASRPPDQPFADKPVAILGATPGRFGTARAQHHLRQVFVGLDAKVMVKPEVMIPGAGGIFGDDGGVGDEATRAMVAGHLAALVDWTRRLKG